MDGPSRSGGLLPLIQDKRILISVGSGGVGKTTVAATAGLLGARSGRRTLVMTIDPARRLATSLGLQELDHHDREVPAAKLRSHGLPPGRMHAMMLDPKYAFDEMVQRYAPDERTAGKLIASKLYQQISTRLAGSQEYAAMEKLYELRRADRYDLLVLDTPPTANALDFLDAPQKMVEAVESPAINLFVRSYRRAGRLSVDLLGFGAAYVVRRLARFTGGSFLDEIAGFLTDLSSLLGGMHDRAAQVQELLARPEVGFVIVISPDPRSIDEAIHFHDRIVDSGMRPAAVVINRVHQLGEVPSGTGGGELPEQDAHQLAPRLAELLPQLPAPRRDALARLLVRSGEQIGALARADAAEVERLRQHCGPDLLYLQVPLFDNDIHDIGGLLELAQYLC